MDSQGRLFLPFLGSKVKTGMFPHFLIHSYTENVVLWAPDFCPLLDSSFYRPLVLFPDPGIFKTIKAGTVGVQNLTILQQKPTLVLIYFSGQSHFSSFLSFFSHLWEFYHFLPIHQCVWFFFNPAFFFLLFSAGGPFRVAKIAFCQK